MSDLFGSIQSDEPDLFAGIAKEIPATVTPVASEQSVDRTARLASVTQIDTTKPDIFSQFDELLDINRKSIQSAGDAGIRTQVAAKQRLDEVNRHTALIHELGQLNPAQDTTNMINGAILATEQSLNTSIEKRAAYALEQEAVKHIQTVAASGDKDQAAMLIQSMERGDVDTIIRDNNAKQLILQRIHEQAGADAEADSWIGKATSFVLSVVPFYNTVGSMGNVEIDKGLEGFFDFLLGGERKIAEASALHSTPIEDFPEVAQKVYDRIKEQATTLGYTDQSKVYNTLSSLMKSKGVIEANSWQMLDNFGWVGPAEFARAGRLPSLLVRNGARREAEGILARAAREMAASGEDVAKASTGLDHVDVVDNLLPHALNPEVQIVNGETVGVSSNVSMSGEVNAAISRVEQITQEFQKLNQLGRMTDEETAVAYAKTVQKLEEEYGKTSIKDVAKKTRVLADGSSVSYVEFTLGKFKSEKKALQYGNDIGYGTSGQVVKDESGSFAFRMTKDIPETGFYTNELAPLITGSVSRFVLNARLIGDKWLGNLSQSASSTRSKILKTLRTETTSVMRKLSNGERHNVSQVLLAGDNEGKWFSRDELGVLWERAYGRQPTALEFDAYDSARDLNDIEHFIRNDNIYKQKVVDGYETVSFKSASGEADRVNAKVLSKWNINTKDRVYDIVDNKSYSAANPMDNDALVHYQKNGYVLVNLDTEIKMADGTITRSVLARKKDLQIENLRREQLGYRAGGHRMYEGKYFLKQARTGVQPDGERFMKNPGVFAVGMTKAQLDDMAARLEGARLAYIQGEDISMVLPSHISEEDFVKSVESGTFNLDHEFRVMYDRETMPEYLNTTGYADMRDVDESDIDGFLRTQGRMYYGGKGEKLRDWQGDLAQTLDPFQVLNRSLMNVANLAAYSDYKITAAERWAKTFGGYLDQQGVGAMEAVRKGTFDSLSVPEEIRQAAEAQREVIRRTLGWRSEWDRQKEVYGRRMAEWVGGTDPYSFRNKATEGIVNWFDNNNPIQALRGLAMDLKLGLFNVAQLPLQIGTLVAATTMHPLHGFHGMVNYAPLRGYITRSGTEAFLDVIVKRGGHTAAGFADPEEYKSMMRQAKQSGFFDLDGNHQLINDYGPASVGNAFSSDGAIRTAGRFFFNEGELANRAVAWSIAWKEARTKLPNAKYDSNDFKALLAGGAEDYSFRMSGASAAYWQKGLLSIPTQFWAYNVRMLETLVGDTFTTEQKVRLFLMQSLMYGSAGVPMGSYISEQIKKHTGKPAELNTVAGFLDRGMLDNMVFNITGQDILVSKRYGTGAFVTDTIKDLFGVSAYGKKSVAEVLGGAGGSISVAGFETVIDLLKYSAAESGGDLGRPLTRDAVMRMLSNISTIANLRKAYYVYNYETLMSNAGSTLATDVPSSTAFAVALGLSPGQMGEIDTYMAYKNDKKGTINEAVKVITNYRTRMVNEPDRREEIQEEINLYVKLLPDDIRTQAIMGSQRTITPSLLDGLEKQIERDKAQSAISANLSEGQ